MRRVGHTGTLDPFATGVIVLCLGKATRLCKYLTDSDKSYRATARLGIETDTEDLTGQIIAECDGSGVTQQQLEAAMAPFRGAILQVPPMYSAKRQGGVRLYELARKGQQVERAPVPIQIQQLTLLRFEPPEFDFEVSCSKGTYIRTLGADLGRAVSVGAHLTALRRTRNGSFQLDEALSLDSLASHEAVREALLPMDRALPGLAALELDSSQSIAFCQGQQVAVSESLAELDALLRIYHREQFLGLGRMLPAAQVQPTLVLATPSQGA